MQENKLVTFNEVNELINSNAYFIKTTQYSVIFGNNAIQTSIEVPNGWSFDMPIIITAAYGITKNQLNEEGNYDYFDDRLLKQSSITIDNWLHKVKNASIEWTPSEFTNFNAFGYTINSVIVLLTPKISIGSQGIEIIGAEIWASFNGTKDSDDTTIIPTLEVSVMQYVMPIKANE